MNINDYSIEQLEAALENKKKQASLPKIPFDSPIGAWKVTTDGDHTGRSIKPLGVYNGHIVDIAKRLAGYAMYQLYFEKLVVDELPDDPESAVHIKLRSPIHAYKFSDGDRNKILQEFLNREKPETEYSVRTSNYFNAVLLEF
jgi:hypothetical protein